MCQLLVTNGVMTTLIQPYTTYGLFRPFGMCHGKDHPLVIGKARAHSGTEITPFSPHVPMPVATASKQPGWKTTGSGLRYETDRPTFHKPTVHTTKHLELFDCHDKYIYRNVCIYIILYTRYYIHMYISIFI